MTQRGTTLWRHPDFMKLWAGQTVSLFGSALTTLALLLIAAVTLSATPGEMGVLAAAGNAPSLIVALFAGVWVDRYRRRTFLIAGDIGRALVLLTIPVAAFFDVLSMPQLYAAAFVAGVFTVFFDIAPRSYLPSVVDAPQLVEGNSKLSMSGSIAVVGGPSLAGVIVQALTAPLAIVVDALSYLASAMLTFRIRKPEQPPTAERTSLFMEARAGLTTVFGHSWLRAFAGCMATSNFMSNIFFALYMLFGVRLLGLNAAQLGLVYGIGAAGSLLAAFLAPRAASRFGIGRILVIGALLGSLEVAPAAVASPRFAVPLMILSSLLGNFGWVLYAVNASSIRQAVTPPELQGRMNATFNFIVAGMLPLGALAGGALGELLGLRLAIVIAAGGSALSFLWIFLSPVRTLTALPEASRPTGPGTQPVD